MLVSLGPRQLSVVERCSYYRGRECTNFGFFGSKRTVRNRELSALE